MMNLNELVGKEMSFADLDNTMMENGFYSVFDDGVTKDIKEDGSVAYTIIGTHEVAAIITFETTIDNSEDEVSENFELKVLEVDRIMNKEKLETLLAQHIATANRLVELDLELDNEFGITTYSTFYGSIAVNATLEKMHEMARTLEVELVLSEHGATEEHGAYTHCSFKFDEVRFYTIIRKGEC